MDCISCGDIVDLNEETALRAKPQHRPYWNRVCAYCLKMLEASFKKIEIAEEIQRLQSLSAVEREKNQERIAELERQIMLPLVDFFLC